MNSNNKNKIAEMKNIIEKPNPVKSGAHIWYYYFPQNIPKVK